MKCGIVLAAVLLSASLDAQTPFRAETEVVTVDALVRRGKTPVARLASEPIAELRSRVAELEKARKPGIKPPASSDAAESIADAVKKLSKDELAACKKAGVEPEEYVRRKQANKAALTPVGGYLPVPEGPGIGVDIDEAAVREAHKDRHRWRNPIFRTNDGSFAEW